MKFFFTAFFLLFILLGHSSSFGQCTTLGQNPQTAFPVCGTTVFNQASVPTCSLNDITPPGCTAYAVKNPFFYKFTCFQTGTLGFRITPLAADEDYDWQLFDITGRNPNEVLTNAALTVIANWSGTYGATGASAAGVSFVQCGSDPASNLPTFSSMPTLIAGHEYILLVSHFSDTQSGYTLSFGGGTAVITDPLEPRLKSASAGCDGKEIRIKLNKKMKCATLSANGSDFTINTPTTSIVSATGIGCSNGFDADSLLLILTNPLAPGNYSVTIKNGADGNTLRDNCDRLIPVGENLPLAIFPIIPTPMDSLAKIGCSPISLNLVFRKPVLCGSVATNGSDFTVTGPVPVTVTGAAATCAGGLTSIISIKLSAPLVVGGTYTIRLQNGTDGNTLLDECNQQTADGSTISFTVSDTVDASFNYNILYGCQRNTVQYTHDGLNGVNSWQWNFDNSTSSTMQNPIINYVDFTQKTATLIVSNGVCKDTTSASIFFDNLLVAAFEATKLVCPNDLATFKDKSRGNISSWNWSFGNGFNGTLQNPTPQAYTNSTSTRDETIRLVVSNNFGCSDTATQKIKVINNCYIAVPSAFTPNGDGMNDYLYPLNAYKAGDLSFSVFNRFGQRMFFTRDWTNKWDGTFKGQGSDPGTYVWMLTYINTDTNRKVEQKGTVILIR